MGEVTPNQKLMADAVQQGLSRDETDRAERRFGEQFKRRAGVLAGAAEDANAAELFSQPRAGGAEAFLGSGAGK